MNNYRDEELIYSVVEKILDVSGIDYEKVTVTTESGVSHYIVEVLKSIGTKTVSLKFTVPIPDNEEQWKLLENDVLFNVKKIKSRVLRSTEFRKHKLALKVCEDIVYIECENCSVVEHIEHRNFKDDWAMFSKLEKQIFLFYMFGRLDDQCYYSWKQHSLNRY